MGGTGGGGGIDPFCPPVSPSPVAYCVGVSSVILSAVQDVLAMDINTIATKTYIFFMILKIKN